MDRGGALTDGMVAAALEAGAAILAVYATAFASRAKADASPVTEADERAEAIILAALRRLAPDVAVVAEEEVAEAGPTQPILGQPVVAEEAEEDSLTPKF